MRGHVEVCLRTLTGVTGRFSDELEAFWREVERLYKCCGVMMIPQEHVPLWHVRAMDQRIPVAFKAPLIPEPLSYVADEKDDPTIKKIDMRTHEGRAMKAQMAGA